MKRYVGRRAALASALRRTLGRPFVFALVVGSSGFVLATLALGALVAWRAAPFAVPAWVQAEALVQVAGAEGEVDLAALRASLRQVDPVAVVDFVGRDAALKELAQRPNLSGIGLAELHPNPLPDAFRVRFAAGAAPGQVEAAVAALRKIKGVDTVEFHAELYRRADTLARLGGRIALLLGGFAAFALLLGGALAMSFRARMEPEEIQVLRLLGADPSILVRPGAYATGLSLLAATLLAWWLVVTVDAWVEPVIADVAQRTGLHWAADPLPAWGPGLLCAAVTVAGTLLAGLGLHLSVRRRLERGA